MVQHSGGYSNGAFLSSFRTVGSRFVAHKLDMDRCCGVPRPVKAQARPKGPPSTHFTRRVLLVMPRRCPFHPLINGSGSSGILVTFSRRTTTYSHSSSEINGMARACGSQPTAPPQRARALRIRTDKSRQPCASSGYLCHRLCARRPLLCRVCHTLRRRHTHTSLAPATRSVRAHAPTSQSAVEPSGV